jgi:DNA-binding IclR family transcriptional regulator
MKENSMNSFDPKTHLLVPHGLISKWLRDLSKQEIAFILMMLHQTQVLDKKWITISYTRISRITGIRPQSISRYIEHLEHLHLIEVDRSKNETTGWPENRYRLCLDTLMNGNEELDELNAVLETASIVERRRVLLKDVKTAGRKSQESSTVIKL